MSTCYQLNSVRTVYGSRTVLDIERLTIRCGSLYLLTGANGAGKSTLLSHLALLSPPTAGELRFGEETVRWQNGALLRMRREVTLVHQSPYLFAGSVTANVAYGLKLRGVRGDEQKRRVDEALALVGLDGFDHRRSRELSGGEAQRVALARALALQTRVLILDEPLANVDRATAELLEGVIVSLPARGTTVIMTTHDPEHTGRLGGERIHLAAGRLAAPHPAHQKSNTEGESEPCPVLPKPAASFSIA